MPAVSKAQKNFFALALKVKQGKIPAQEVSDELAKAAKEYDEKEIKAYAETPEEGLPDKVGEKYELDEMDATATPGSVNGMGSVRNPGNPGAQGSFTTQETGSGDIAATSALTDGDEEEEKDELKKLKKSVMLGENVLTFDSFINESNNSLNEGVFDTKYEVTGRVTYNGPMFQEQAQNMGESEKDIANAMAYDLGLVNGKMQWDNDELLFTGVNKDGQTIVVNQKGEYNMYGGPYTPKMEKFKASLGGKNMTGPIMKAFKSYGWDGDVDMGRTDIYGHVFSN